MTTMMMVSKKVITVSLPGLNTAIFDGFSRRCTRSDFCSTNLPSFHDLCTKADRNMFHKVLSYPGHVLHHLLLPVSSISQTYSLRPRAHDRVLPEHRTRLIDCNFTIRLLCMKSVDIYRISLIIFYYCVVHFCIVLCSIAFCQLVRINGL